MFYGKEAVIALAGKQTDANFKVDSAMTWSIFSNRYASQIIFALLGSGGITYGIGQRRLYRAAVEKLKRLNDLERSHDPNRSSSGLRVGWKNNPNDPE